MNNQLKACPFCGEEANVMAVNKSYGFTIWCQCGCGARTQGYCPDTNNENNTMINIENCKNKAIEDWNRRANNEVD